jgi:hypothetical protein
MGCGKYLIATQENRSCIFCSYRRMFQHKIRLIDRTGSKEVSIAIIFIMRSDRMPSKREKQNKPKRAYSSAAKPTMKKDPSLLQPGISRWRLLLFRFAAVILMPLLFLALLEMGLRLGGYGYPPGFFLGPDSKGVYRTNPQFGWRFFPPALARTPIQSFLSPKSDKAIRIFVLGESAAQGVPDPTFSFGQILGVMLQDRYPNIKFEVVNAAMTAINSHGVLEIARDCAARQPDLWVVYMGNNEVVGPYGPGTIFQEWTPSWRFVRANIRLKSMRMGQLFEHLMGSFHPKQSPATWRGMEMFLDNPIAADDPRMTTVYGNFKRNLNDICRIGRDAGTGIILSTVAVNLRDCPPFASKHRVDLSVEDLQKWESIYRAGVELEAAKQWQDALVKYESAAKMDSHFAELQFRMGRCYEAEGLYQKAREHFVVARNLDVLRFRADTTINKMIRETAAAQKEAGVQFVDVDRLFEENGRMGIGILFRARSFHI